MVESSDRIQCFLGKSENAECRMQNAECRMQNAESRGCHMRDCGIPISEKREKALVKQGFARPDFRVQKTL